MNLSSGIIVGILLVLAGLAVWRNIRKGAPCSCGGCSGCGGGCHCGGARGARALPVEGDCAAGDGEVSSHTK